MLVVKVTLRRIWHSPAASSALVLTLALAIGTNAVIFSFVHRILLEGLPYRDPDGIVRVSVRSPTGPPSSLTSREVADWRASTKAFERIGAFRPTLSTLTGRTDPLRVRAADVSRDLFSVLGVSPAAGRAFQSEDSDATRNIVISHALWQSRFGGSDVLDHAVELDGQPAVVVGIMPSGFFFPDAETAIWRLLDRDRPVRAPDGRTVAVVSFLEVIGRLRPSSTVPHVTAEGNAILNAHRNVAQRPQRIEARTLQEQLVAPVRPALLLLQAAGLLLLVAVVMNVTNLFLVRLDLRRHESAVRVALGASKFHILSEALFEAGLFGAAGSLGGVALASLALPAIKFLAPSDTPRLGDVAVDPAVVGTAVATAWFVSVLSALLAWTGYGRAASVRDRVRDGFLRPLTMRSVLAVVQIAMAFVLGIGATLVAASVITLFNAPLGFDTSSVLSFQASLAPSTSLENSARRRLWQMVLNEASVVRGVQSAALTSSLPLTGALARMEIAAEAPTPEFHMYSVQLVSPGYFRTLQIPLRSGRTFEAGDTSGTEAVLVVSAQLAERLFGTPATAGRRVRMAGRVWSIVGVVGDVHHRGPLTPAEAIAYVPVHQAEYFSAPTARSLLSTMGAVVRTSIEPAAVAPLVRAAIRDIDGRVPVYDVMTLSERLGARLRQATFALALFSGFAGVTLIVALVGVYGLLCAVVHSRTREIGVRLALGATPRQAMTWIGGYAGRLAAAGLLVGIPAAISLSSVIRHALPATDALSASILMFCITGLVVAVAVAACGPASRAAHIDPAQLLRME